MNAEKINTATATEEKPKEDISSLLDGLDEVKNSDKELVLSRSSRGVSVSEQAKPHSTDIATLPTEQTSELELSDTTQPNPETKSNQLELVRFGQAVLNTLAVLANHQTQSAETAVSPQAKTLESLTDTNQNQTAEKSSGLWTNYERARYYQLLALLGLFASKFVGGDSATAETSNKRRSRAIPESREVKAYRTRIEPRGAIDLVAASAAVPRREASFSSPDLGNLWSNLYGSSDGTTKTESIPESAEVKLYGEATSLLNTLAEEKYGVSSWTQLGSNEQKRIRNRALAELHPDRGGDQALYQKVESMIMSQPLTEPIKGAPAEAMKSSVIPEASPTDEATNYTSREDSPKAPAAHAVNKNPLAIEAAPVNLALEPAPTVGAIQAAPTRPAIASAPATNSTNQV